ncbi:hypothetical protein JXB02_02960 [Candidatus Woesearchaeota archaeon]|nr:hypothetical protein [Candidatus Woesearchaeota archaeon]
MTDLIACLSTGKGTWGDVARVIDGIGWDQIFLITNEFGKEKFSSGKSVTLVIIDPSKPLPALVDDIRKALKGRVLGTEVGINLASGTGKEHMAVLSAVMRLGVGFRLVGMTDEGPREV